MDYRKKIQIRTILIIATSWVFMSMLIYSYGYALLSFTNPDQQLWGIDFLFGLAMNIFIGFMGGIIGGYLTTLNLYSAKTSFGRTILVVALNFILVFVFVYFFGSALMFLLINYMDTGIFNVGKDQILNLTQSLLSPFMLITLLIWAFIMAGTVFMMEVDNKFGQGVLWNFIRGKYFHPREEDRIFMFLDLKSSTNIAEQIGHHQYFLFIKDFFADITRPILERNGHIQQYVGDEVVVTWTLSSGIENANCLACFFEIKNTIGRRVSYYQGTYGVLPEFKAGLHVGKVTIGEIGIVKKDITYSGDVLNTTSRIQNECNRMGREFLVSSDIISKINSEDYAVSRIGEVQLRGKDQKVEINAVELLPPGNSNPS